MFKQLSRQTSLYQRTVRSFATPALQQAPKLNYYKVLEVTSDSTPEQIKASYRELVKKHHPDVAGSSSPDGQIFRNIMEAYGVLSVNESRASYDLSMKKDPDAFRDVSEAEFAKNNNFEVRDASGNVLRKAPIAGGYAEERMAELKMQRDKYNVNHIGLYRGGLPKKGRGAIRGSALGYIGEFH